MAPVQDPSKALLLTSPLSTAGKEACYKLLADVPPAHTNVLVVSYTGQPTRWLAEWRDHVGEPPTELGYIVVGPQTRATMKTAPGAADRVVDTTTINPSDLTGLGIAVTEYLDGWASNDNATVVCFDSVTVLLQYVDKKTAYQFLHVLLNKLAAVGSDSHFHVDPEAHDSTTMSTLRPLFDTVVER